MRLRRRSIAATAMTGLLSGAGLLGVAANPALAAPARPPIAAATAGTPMPPAVAGPPARAVVAALTAPARAVAAAAPRRARPSGPGILNLQTVPPMAGVVVNVDGSTARSDEAGRIAVPVNDFTGLKARIKVPETKISTSRSVVFDRFRGDPDSAARGKVIEMGLRTRRLVSWRFVDRIGADVEVDKVQSMRIRSNTGEINELSGAALAKPLWVSESRTQQGPNGLVSKRLYWVVDGAMVGGASVVNKAQQRFFPWDQQLWLVQLLFYKVVFTAGDLFFTRQVGNGIELVRPDGRKDRLAFGPDGKVSVSDLPRGTYTIKAYGGGVSFGRPVNISKDQEVSMDVISRIDLGLVAGTLIIVAVGLILLGRPHLRPRWPGRWPSRWPGRWPRGWPGRWPRRWRRSRGPDPEPEDRRGLPEMVRRLTRTGGAVVVAVLLTGIGLMAQPQPARAQQQASPVPVFAYYYIWFNPTSWNRAKIDYPLLGRYSSDDTEIMRRHIRMAKAAGITGFLVSWKHTPLLDERLKKLTDVARAEKFHLGIVYQGLDFDREPLPMQTVQQDMTLFADRYATDPVYKVFDKPVVVWTGSNRFDRKQIDTVIRGIRTRLLVLGDAKTADQAAELTPVMDGQAYYWSSVDPSRGTSRTKLVAMSNAVHRGGGLFFAPIAPGFDARLVGGSKSVPRRSGQTLRASYDIAIGTNPDAIGMISWNEFSENTHIEPSEKYGTTDLNVLADLLGAGANIQAPVDSSDDNAGHAGLTSWGALALLTAGAGLLPLTIAISRRRRAAHTVKKLTYEIEHLPGEGQP
jgi:hypothetical protein